MFITVCQFKFTHVVKTMYLITETKLMKLMMINSGKLFIAGVITCMANDINHYEVCEGFV